jgi:branched-chain amino acid transport system permease protein
MTYLYHLGVILSLYIILAISLNLMMGYMGLLSICQAGFYGIGAYAATLLVVKGNWSFAASLVAAVIIAAISSICIGLASLRLRGDYFVLSTLGFQVIVFSLLYNWTSLTNGPNGIPGIPPPQVFGIALSSPGRYFCAACALAAIVAGLAFVVVRSPFGRLMQAIRDDELAAISFGKNCTKVRLTVFAFGACLAAVAGAFYAGYARYVDPTSFTVAESIFIVSMVAVGGTGSFGGPLLGAVLLTLLPEGLRFVGMPESIAANLRQIIYGLALLILMRFRPQGIIGKYSF